MWLLGLILGLLTGFYSRELLSVLKRIESRMWLLNKSNEKPKPTSSAAFAEPMTNAEVIAMIEQEKVDALNQR